MKIIISPAKKMKEEFDVIENLSQPIFLKRAKELSSFISKMDFNSLQKLFVANSKITEQNYQRYQNMNFDANLTPAILAYDGIQYKYMAPIIFENKYFEYVQNHVRILSGLYGVLKPLDGVCQYRLELGAKLKIGSANTLYEYWGDSIYQKEFMGEDIIINLSSKEYSNSIKKHVLKTQRWLDIIFGEKINSKVVEKGVYVKMARGEMVRYMAENNISNVEEIKKFNRQGYKFSQEDSTKDKYVFIKENKND